MFSTLGDYHEYSGGYHDECGGYHEYTGGGGGGRGYHEYTIGIWYEWEKTITKFPGFLFKHLLRLCSSICWPLEHQKAF